MVNIHMLGVAVCAFRDFRILPVQRKITEKKLRTPRLVLKTAVTKKNIPLQEHSGHKEQTSIEKGNLFPKVGSFISMLLVGSFISMLLSFLLDSLCDKMQIIGYQG